MPQPAPVVASPPSSGFPMVQGPRGRAFVTGAPLIAEPMRLLALAWARKNATAPTQETPIQLLEDLVGKGVLFADVQDYFTKTDEARWKRAWRPADFIQFGAVLESWGALPLATVNGRDPDTVQAVGAVPIRLVPVCSSWTNAPLVNIDRAAWVRGALSVVAADWTPVDRWPLLLPTQQDVLPPGARARLSMFLRHALLDHLRDHPEEFATPAYFDAHLDSEPVAVYGNLSPQEAQRFRNVNTARRWVCCQVVDGNAWASSLALSAGLADHAITPQQSLASIDPLSETLTGVSVIAAVTDRQGNSGFLSPRGILTQSISSAAIYPDITSAQRSVKGYGSGRRGVLSDTAVYFQAEVRLVGVAPDSVIKEGRANEFASGVLSRLDRAALQKVVAASPADAGEACSDSRLPQQPAAHRCRRL